MEKNLKRKRIPKEEISCEEADKFVIRDMMNMIGDKWSLSVIGVLAICDSGKARFSEIARSVEGISQRMLTITLRNLERDGILSRKIYPEIPPRVEYELTDLGESLTVPIKGLVDWIKENSGEMLVARDKFDNIQK